MSDKTRILIIGMFVLMFFIFSPSEEEKKEFEKIKMEQLANDVKKIDVLNVDDNLEAYKQLHTYYSDNDEYKKKYQKYEDLDNVSSSCLYESIELNKQFLKNSNTYDNEKYKYGEWKNEKTFVVVWEFTGKNAFNVEYKFNSKYECKVKADGSAIIKQIYIHQI